MKLLNKTDKLPLIFTLLTVAIGLVAFIALP